MGNQTSNSIEEIKKMVRRKLREEEEARSSQILEDLASGKQKEGELQEEKSLLAVVLNSEAQIKTLCAKPTMQSVSLMTRLEGIETHHFKSSPIIESSDEDAFHKKFKIEIRTWFKNTSSFPQSVHGLVKADLGDGVYRTGTGILIGPDLVLTAAHNLYDVLKTKKKYSNVYFIPGMNEGIAPFGNFKVVESYVPEVYLQTWKKEDYALLVLDGVAGLYAGYFGLHVAEKQLLKGKELNVIGYPGYVRTKDEKNELKLLHSIGCYQQWGMKGGFHFNDKDEESGEFLLQYRNDKILTTPGQSGSGVFYHDNDTDQYYIIGVHVLGGREENSCNSATWITRDRFKQIAGWASQYRRKLIAQKISSEGRDGELKIRSVNLSIRFIGDEGLEVLSAYLMPKLESLYLAGNNISDTGVRTLCGKSKWSELRCLNLADNNLTEEGADTLGRSKCWTKLERLSLHNNQIKDAGASVLARNKFWTNLKQLIMSSNEIGTKGANGLLRNKTWIRLEELSLRANRIGAEVGIRLESNCSWENLKVLDLGANSLGDQGVVSLAETTAWKNLEILKLHNNQIKDAGASVMASNKSWTSLKQLILSSNEIGTKGANGLLRNKTWIRLEELSLRANRIGADVGIEFESNCSWKNLKDLDLGANSLGDWGVVSLTEATTWRNLETLKLDSNKITDEGAIKMATHLRKWKHLEELCLLGNEIKEEILQIPVKLSPTVLLLLQHYELDYYISWMKGSSHHSPWDSTTKVFKGEVKVSFWSFSRESNRRFHKMNLDFISHQAPNSDALIYIYDMADKQNDLVGLKSRISNYRQYLPRWSKLYLVGSSKYLEVGQRSIFEEMKKFGDTIGAESLELGSSDEDGDKLLDLVVKKLPKRNIQLDINNPKLNPELRLRLRLQ